MSGPNQPPSEKAPKVLLIDFLNRKTEIVRSEVPGRKGPENQRSSSNSSGAGAQCLEFEADRIKGFDIDIALNGGYSVKVKYHGKSRIPDTLVFSTKEELLNALGNLLIT